MPTHRKHECSAARQRAYRERVLTARLAERELKGLPCVPAIPTMPSIARGRAMIAEARAILSEAEREIQTYINDRSDAWQESQKAERWEEFRLTIEEVVESLQTIPI